MRTTTPEDIGSIARQRRIDMGLSQEELAERAGVTRQWLSRFEQAKSDASISKVMVVLRELELSVDIRSPDAPSIGIGIEVPTIRFPVIDPDMLRRLASAADAAISPSISESMQRAIEQLSANVSANVRASALMPDLAQRLSGSIPDLTALSNMVRMSTRPSEDLALPDAEAHEFEEDQ